MTEEWASDRFWRTTWIAMAAAIGAIWKKLTYFGVKTPKNRSEAIQSVTPVIQKWYAARETWRVRKEGSDMMALLVNTYSGRLVPSPVKREVQY
jgi:hypothetical protein